MINPSSKKLVIWFWGLAIGYFLSGIVLSEFLTQSQVVSVWLPAGVGLFGCYIWSWRFVPAIFFASMAFNLSNHDLAHLVADNWREVFIIASGASLQGIVGGSILRRWLGNPLDSNSDFNSLFFVSIIGLLTNLISSNIGVMALSAYNIEYSSERYWYNVMNWWLGDSLGVLLGTLLLFCLLNFSSKDIQIKKARSAIMLTTAIMFFSVTMTSHYLASNSRETTKNMVEHEIKLIENSLYREINKSLAHIQTLSSFIQNSPYVSKRDFEVFAKGLMQEQSAIKGMSWNVILSQSEVDQFENQLADLYGREIKVKGEPLKDEDHLVAVKIITPEEGNEAAIGFNVYSNPSRKSVLSKPDSLFRPLATPIIQLVQSESSEAGFLLFAPVFAVPERASSNEVSIPQRKLVGYATGIFLVQQMLDVAMEKVPPGLFLYEMVEQDSDKVFLGNTQEPTFSLQNEPNLKVIILKMAGRTWTMNLVARDNFLLHYQEESTRIMILLQFTVVTFLVLFILISNNRRIALDTMVEVRTKELELARKLSEQASEAKSRFLANMSHEIRTPLNAVIGFSSLVKHSDEPEEVGLYLQKIELSSRTLLNIVNDILDISKIEAEKLTLETIPFDLNQILHQLQVIFESSAVQKKLNWTVSSDMKWDGWFCGDPTRLEQILINLCGNAFKFTGQGEVALEVNEKIQKDGRSLIEFTVRDTGIGISSEGLEKLFEAFNQADTSTSRRFGGTGLGLTISRELARLMGGNISAKSIEGLGSEFIVNCWFDQAPAQETYHSENDAHDLSGLRVLVAEDNAVNQMMIQAILKRAGMDPVLASNGKEACDLVKSNKFDVILMDIQMPVMDGYQATRQIRQDYPLNVLPIIALTADVMPEDKIRVIECGCNDHMAKPIEVDKLLGCLSEIATANKAVS